MAITTLSGVISGLQPPVIGEKVTSAFLFDNAPTALTNFYSGGYPAAASAPTPGVAGAALTSYAGQIPFPNPSSGNAYLARFEADLNDTFRNIMLVDRLWHNSGLSGTTTTAQTVNSVAWPARDINGSTDGEGVYIAVEFSGASGSGAPVITMSYTNSAGASGKTATNLYNTVANSAAGRVYLMGLAAGDTGVRSIQSVTFSVSWGVAGNLHLVAYRPISYLNTSSCQPATNNSAADDALTLGMPRMWNSSVPYLLYLLNSGNNSSAFKVQYTHG